MKAKRTHHKTLTLTTELQVQRCTRRGSNPRPRAVVSVTNKDFTRQMRRFKEISFFKSDFFAICSSYLGSSCLPTLPLACLYYCTYLPIIPLTCLSNVISWIAAKQQKILLISCNGCMAPLWKIIKIKVGRACLHRWPREISRIAMCIV